SSASLLDTDDTDQHEAATLSFAYTQTYQAGVQLTSSAKHVDDTDAETQSTRTMAVEQSVAVQTIGETPVATFLQSFRTSGSEFVSSAYLMDRSPEKSRIDGSLSTSLPEDVFTLVDTQITLLNEYLESSNLTNTDTGDAIAVDALMNVFRILSVKQGHYRDAFFRDFGSCIAAANDFLRMSEKTEELIADIRQNRYYSHLSWEATEAKEMLSEWDISTGMVEQEASNLIDLFQKDAVIAAQRSSIYMIHAVQMSSDIPSQLFSYAWEEELTYNQVAKAMVRTYVEYLDSLQQLLAADYLYHKIVTALVRSTVCFYIQCFVVKADKARRRLQSHTKKNKLKYSFVCPQRAVMRMSHDMKIFEEFFLNLAEGNVTLKRIVSNELSIFKVVVLELMSYATGQSGTDSLHEFVVVVHKRTGADPDVTRHFLSDIYVLLGSKKEYLAVEHQVRGMKDELERMTERVEEKRTAGVLGDKTTETTFRLDKMLRTVYEDRIAHEKLSLCGNLMTDMKGAGKSMKTEMKGLGKKMIDMKGIGKKRKEKREEIVILSDEDESDDGKSKISTWQQKFDQLKEILLLDDVHSPFTTKAEF
ncbi:MAG: hypothetical protein SGILL_004993, partial [Bacillariaceae sp.]